MPGTWSKLVTVTTGQLITAAERNNEFDNVITNDTPDGCDDASANVAAMQLTTNPGGVSSESLATDLTGELKRLRYILTAIHGGAQWYVAPATNALLKGGGTMSGALLLADGLVSAPGISFGTDPDCGIYRIGTNNIGLASNGIKALDLGTDGSVDVRGTTTNDAGAAGFMGEYIESLFANFSFTTSGQYTDAGSLALTAGDWDVSYSFQAVRNGATWTSLDIGIGTVTGNDSTGMSAGSNSTTLTLVSTIDNICGSLPNFRVSLSGSSTRYLKISAAYTVATPKIYGRISARRVR